MKEIGAALKEARENTGLSLEEVSSDLKLRPSQVENIEQGNIEAFKDVFYLKYFIRDYAKYLGLDEEKIMNEFNEYLFDFTSKIPVDKIEEAKKQKSLKKNIISPYTKVKKDNSNLKIIIGIIILIVIIVVGYFVISGIKGNDFQSENETYIIRR